MVYKISIEEEEWLEKARVRELTPLQVRRKFQEREYKDEEIETLVDYYKDVLNKEEESKEVSEINVEEEKKFEKQVKEYIKDKNTLSWKERRIVKKWIKNMETAIKTLKVTIEGIKKENEYILKNFEDNKSKIDKELEALRLEVIDRVMDTEEMFDIEHPYQEGIRGTKENLKDVKLEDLINLIEENIEEFELVVNGKV